MAVKKSLESPIIRAYEEFGKKMYIEGARTINKEYSHLAGKMLGEGDGRLMAVHNGVIRDLAQLSKL